MEYVVLNWRGVFVKLFLLLVVVLAFNFWPSQSFAQTEGQERENRRDHTSDTSSLSAEGASKNCSRIDEIALTDNTVAQASGSTSGSGVRQGGGQGIAD